MRKKIGELLVEAGATTLDDVKAGLGAQRSWGAGQRLGQVLVSMGKATPTQVAKALSAQFDLPFVELPQIPAAVSAMVPLDFQSEHRVVPFRLELEGKVERLCLAVADPEKLDLVDELRFQLGKPVRVFIAATDELEEVLSALRGDQIAELDPLEIDEEPGELVLERTAEQVPQGWFATSPALPPEWDLFETSTGPTATDLPPPPAQTDLDDLLGGGSAAAAAPPAPAPAPALASAPAPAPRPAEVMKFAPPPKPPEPSIDFSEEDLRVLENLERMAQGEEPTLESVKVKPAQMVASLIRLLMRKGVIAETEFLEELSRK